MNRDALLAFLRENRLAVESTVSPAGAPRASVVGFAVTDDFEIVFDTLDTTRKVASLRRDARIALVIGWDHERTAQVEGVADEPTGAELGRLKAAYFLAFPDGRSRQAWPGITYVRVRPTWIRYSDFTRSPAGIVEFDATSLSRGGAPR